MPNIISRFMRAPDRREWMAHYFAKKLGVDLRPPLEAPAPAEPPAPVEAPVPVEPPAAPPEPSVVLQPAQAIAEPFVEAADLVAARGVDGSHWITHRSDGVVGRAIRVEGQFQEEAVDDCLALLEKLGMPVSRRIFMDVGANIGTHTIRAANLGFEKILALEPDPTNFALLNANVALRGLEGRVRCRNVAASQADGTMQMELSPSNFGDHRMLGAPGMRGAVHGEDAWTTSEVRACRLDTLLKEEIPSEVPSLVWIDTQGHEGHVLAGAERLRSSGCPMVMEFWPYGLERSGGLDLLRQALKNCGRIFDLTASTPDAPVEVTLADLDAMFDDFLSRESPANSPHTDLLVVR